MNSDNLPIKLSVGIFKRQGAILPDNLSLAEWKALWTPLRDLGGSVRLIRGDWLNYGATRFASPIEADAEEKLDAGEQEKAHRRRVNKFAASLTTNKEDYRALAYEAWVSRSVPMSRRRKSLTWSHYVEVAALEPKDQGKYLSLAETGNLSAGQLRRELRAKRSTKQESQVGSSGFILGCWVDQGMRHLRVDDVASWDIARADQVRNELERLIKHINAIGAAYLSSHGRAIQ
jgi:hypothetical protein